MARLLNHGTPTVSRFIWSKIGDCPAFPRHLTAAPTSNIVGAATAPIRAPSPTRHKYAHAAPLLRRPQGVNKTTRGDETHHGLNVDII